jgi:hypothetical protein
MWRVQGEAGRWAEWNDQGFTADEQTLDRVRAMIGEPLTVTPVGPEYPAAANIDTDTVWCWLAANRAIPSAVRLVAGAAPKLPVPAPVEGAAY